MYLIGIRKQIGCVKAVLCHMKSGGEFAQNQKSSFQGCIPCCFPHTTSCILNVQILIVYNKHSHRKWVMRRSHSENETRILLPLSYSHRTPQLLVACSSGKWLFALAFTKAIPQQVLIPLPMKLYACNCIETTALRRLLR